MQKAIVESLQCLQYEFAENELAYLALTTKIELPFRDRWAFLLHKKLSNKNVIVSREWQRTDLALLKNQSPKALIELKAMYSFNAVNCKTLQKFATYMADDVKKAQKLASNDHEIEIYTVLLATHPKKIPPNYAGIIKYDTGINKAICEFKSADKVKSAAIKAVNDNFLKNEKNVISHDDIPAGTAFGVKTSILYWVMRHK